MSCLFLIDLALIGTSVSKMDIDYFSGRRNISHIDCGTQIFFFLALGMSDLLNLSYENPTIYEMVLLVTSIILLLILLVLILTSSHMLIFFTILHMKSHKERGKTLATYSSHLSVEYILHMLRPLIYILKNAEVVVTLSKLLYK
ncbi:hypothetical protein EI555_010263 [Monodon monoceros]|uniref:G-protein coupled receptors family 1 profile domain-containing protein n=1 Tax=Monodon monoceros TaxID=40151 RepID=A0A4U1F0T2_MONMO|nr:hypothetical protein EI555_010263 [Monodon monoceros]